MGLLPVQRTLTFALGDKVPAAFLNELEDMIIGRKKPPWPRSFFPKLIFPGNAVWNPDLATSLNPAIISTGAATTPGFVEVPCEEGDRVTGLSAEIFNSGGGGRSAALTLYYGVGMGAFAPIGTTTSVGAAAAWANLVVPVTAQLIGVRGGLHLACEANGAGFRVGMLHATFDRL